MQNNFLNPQQSYSFLGMKFCTHCGEATPAQKSIQFSSTSNPQLGQRGIFTTQTFKLTEAKHCLKSSRAQNYRLDRPDAFVRVFTWVEFSTLGGAKTRFQHLARASARQQEAEVQQWGKNDESEK